jgi:hypothetical protein
MKTRLLTIFFILNILYSHAQLITNVGIKAGVSISNQTWQYRSFGQTEKYEYKAGIYSVLTAELFKGKFLSLSSDLGFVQKGMKQHILLTSPEFPEGNGEYYILKTTINYITFSPILKGFYSFKRLTPYGLIGPRIDYRVSYEPHINSEIYNESNKLILGLTYGLGAEYKIDRFGILLECLGHPDFTAIMDQQPTETNFGLKITGNSYIVTTGVKYYLH